LRTDIQAARGVAALLVVLQHADAGFTARLQSRRPPCAWAGGSSRSRGSGGAPLHPRG
jgi:peptidoglycan/LPS O-acetylase OafA/YrhL